MANLKMNLNNYLINIKKRFRELWEYKIFRVAIFTHIFIFILSQVLTLSFFRDRSDFQVYYAAADVFLHDFTSLYTKGYIVPFRYFPISASLFVPFYLMGFDLGFIMFNLISLILNILICLLIYKIIMLIRGNDLKKEDKKVILYICLFLMGLPNLFNYILGQINLYVTFLILLSLFLFIKHEENKWNLLASFILGLSIIIKPTAFLLIPFLIIINVDLEKRKITFDSIKSFLRLLGVLTPILFNFILFFLYPTLWDGFLEANFTGNNPIAQSFSFSISQLITNFYYFYNIPFNQIIILVVVIGIIGGLGYIIFIFRKSGNDSIIYCYTIGILITLLGYFDSWDHHLLNLIPLLIIVIFTSPRNSKNIALIKSSLIFLSFFSLVFTGIWFRIYPIFPYNFESTIFLILTFYAICNYFLNRQEKKNKGGIRY